MMPHAEEYPFVTANRTFHHASMLPCLPRRELELGPRTISAIGLLDTGAAVNVLPFDLGRQLGAIWENQTMEVRLTGNLALQEARVGRVER